MKSFNLTFLWVCILVDFSHIFLNLIQWFCEVKPKHNFVFQYSDLVVNLFTIIVGLIKMYLHLDLNFYLFSSIQCVSLLEREFEFVNLPTLNFSFCLPRLYFYLFKSQCNLQVLKRILKTVLCKPALYFTCMFNSFIFILNLWCCLNYHTL